MSPEVLSACRLDTERVAATVPRSTRPRSRRDREDLPGMRIAGAHPVRAEAEGITTAFPIKALTLQSPWRGDMIGQADRHGKDAGLRNPDTAATGHHAGRRPAGRAAGEGRGPDPGAAFQCGRGPAEQRGSRLASQVVVLYGGRATSQSEAWHGRTSSSGTPGGLLDLVSGRAT